MHDNGLRIDARFFWGEFIKSLPSQATGKRPESLMNYLICSTVKNRDFPKLYVNGVRLLNQTESFTHFVVQSRKLEWGATQLRH